MEFHNVELRCLCLASEDPDRVRRAFGTAMGLDMPPGGDEGAGPILREAGVREEHSRGQFHNPILIISCTFTRRREVRAFWARMALRGEEVLQRLREELEARVDEEFKFHFRLDKQKAYGGRLVLGSGGDTIAVQSKLKVFTGGREKAIADLGEFLAGLVADPEDGASFA